MYGSKAGKMDRINVTKTFVPPFEEYEAYLKKIWESAQLTNQGNLLKEFEKKTSRYLGVKNFHFVSNGTIALQTALKALEISSGEIITTPFSYVATTSSILWERCKPVFVDIDPKTLTIDPDKIEEAITPKTKAILGVHVFGNPCDVESIEKIAQKHNLKVIYDAAHAFGVRYNGKSVYSFGDISTGSFHATKVFHTIEGGCVVLRDNLVSDNLELIKKFGHHGDDHKTLGINAKASEFQAAMGLCNLKYITSNIKKRKALSELYDKLLGKSVERPTLRNGTEHNYAYYPILLQSEKRLLQIVQKLSEANIFPRRYFYPSLNRLPYLEDTQECPVSENVASRILCLPLYPELSEASVRQIANTITS